MRCAIGVSLGLRSRQLSLCAAPAFELPRIARGELSTSVPVPPVALSSAEEPTRRTKLLTSTARAVWTATALANFLEVLEYWLPLLCCEHLVRQCCRRARDLGQIFQSRGPDLYVPGFIEHVHNAAADFQAK
jgi:hypothetical protein